MQTKGLQVLSHAPGPREVTGMQHRCIWHGGCQRDLHLTHPVILEGSNTTVSQRLSIHAVNLCVPRCSQAIHAPVLEFQHGVSAVVRTNSPVSSRLTLIRCQYKGMQTALTTLLRALLQKCTSIKCVIDLITAAELSANFGGTSTIHFIYSILSP